MSTESSPGLPVEGNREGATARENDSVLRDVIEALTVAIALSLTIKQFAIEAYKVPTGSMEPAIHGDPEVGDRILVDRIGYLARAPRRWEIAVFQFPNNLTISYVKRIVGLPGESIFLIGGDVYTGPPGAAYRDITELWRDGELRIQRKPRALQDAIFDRFPQIVDGTDRPEDLASFVRNWRVEGLDDGGWRYDEGVVARSESRALAVFKRAVMDSRLDVAPGQDANAPAKFHVGDRRLEVEVEPLAEGGALVFEMRDAYHALALEARVPVRGAKDDGGLYIDGERVAALDGFRLVPGRRTRLSFANADDRLRIEADGETLLEHDYRHEPVRTERPWEVVEHCAFGVEGGALRFTRTQLARDLHYRAQSTPRTEVTEGHYFVLGDNSGASKDSREWYRVTVRPPSLGGREIYGDSEAVLDPERIEHRVDNPWKEYDSDTGDLIGEYFMDHLGNRHDITEGGHGSVSRDPSPLVPRSLILGRAVAIFWPWKRVGLVR
ncbi:MAG: signal peptidase I [Planctomycetota bacterium]